VHPLRHNRYGEHLKSYIAYLEQHYAADGGKKAWQREAMKASALRAAGAFDACERNGRNGTVGSVNSENVNGQSGKDIGE